jgi:hypothetical protein
MLMNVVRYGRRIMGATSEAYWAATLWNAPHGIPKILAATVLSRVQGTLTAKDFTRNKHLDVGRKEQSKDRSDHHDQEAQGCHFRPISIRDPAGDDEADDLARAGSI